MIAYITVGETYNLAWWLRPQVDEGKAHWYHFKNWDPHEIEFTEKDLVENGDYEYVYEVYRSETFGRWIKRNAVTKVEDELYGKVDC